jgi:hypothetical protein
VDFEGGEMKINPPLEERFWNKVIKTDGCWGWLGHHNQNGYGTFKHTNESLAHRAAWVLIKGEIPSGMCVLHRCDNPGCVNPDHLFLGTMSDNSQDMMNKGRHPKFGGEQNNKAKLKESDVADIRNELKTGIRPCVLARRYQMTGWAISCIKHGYTWKNITGGMSL